MAEKNLFQLFEELRDGTYKIGKSIAFVVDQPTVREIWASGFRDRIVHHIIYNRLTPIFHPAFITTSFACIPGRGSIEASNQLWQGMRSITENWQKNSYFLKADVRSFFVSIHKPTLFSILEKKIQLKIPSSVPWLLNLIEQVLFHDPKLNCFCKSKPSAFERVPKHKSLFHIEKDKGLPIGNLTSQFFANVYLNELDQFVKHHLQAKYYYRYVDDFVLLNDSPQILNDQYKKIDEFLSEKLKLDLHPFKKQIGRISHGVDFVGFIHKPYRRYLRNRTVNKMKSAIDTRGFVDINKYEATGLCRSLNSYFGLLRVGSHYNLRKKMGAKVKIATENRVGPSQNFIKVRIYS
jgi:retron-type reverse transcriptase